MARLRGIVFLVLKWGSILFGALLLLGAVSTNAYHRIGRSQLIDRHPPPGRMVNIGTHEMHIHCQGSGVPTVVIESGAMNFSAVQAPLMNRLESVSRVCTYDRSGLGWSEPSPEQPTAESRVRELHSLLGAAGEAGPYVLVGESMGWSIVNRYEEQFPNDVVGLVSVDGIPANVLEIPADNLRTGQLGRSQGFLLFLERLGLFPTNLLPLPDLSELREKAGMSSDDEELFSRPGFMHTRLLHEICTYEEMADYISRPRSLGAKPLIVLAHGEDRSFLAGEDPDEAGRLWREGQARESARSSVGELRIAENSGHALILEAPELIVEAVRDIVNRYTQAANQI